MTKVLKIKATADGYRRAGFGFSTTAETVLPLNKLSQEQIEALKADKNLLVVEAEEKPAKGADDAAGGNTGPNASAAAIKLAEEYKIDLSTLTGTGAGGAITKGDVEKAIEVLTGGQ